MTDFSCLLSSLTSFLTCNNNFVYFTRSKLLLFLTIFPKKNALINRLLIKLIKNKIYKTIKRLS